jgi:Arc/MetJ-type ribon-helix-helix transcriptional regulator
MTRYEKITISLPSRAAQNARRAVKAGRAESVSAYIVDALDKHSATYDLGAVLAEMFEESGGPPTPAELRAARRELGLDRKRPVRQRRAAKR